MSELSNMRVLIVDDSEASVDILVDTLGNEYRINVAMDGDSALDVIRRNRPNLILLDVVMPGKDGYQVCGELKADESTREIPVIFLTGKAGIEDIVKGFSLGAVDYIAKPFNTEEVMARVKTHLENQELHRKLAKENWRFKTLAEAAFEGIFIHENGKIIDVNSEGSRLFNRDQHELLGRNIMRLLPLECQSSALNEEAKPWEGEITNSFGKQVPVEVRTKKFEFEDHPVRVTAIRDLSLQKTIENEKMALQNENMLLKDNLKERYKFGNIIGRSPAMQKVYEQIAQAASSDFNVIIFGESGTGKELVAKTIYELDHNNNRAFVPVNCGAITESLFEREFFGHRKGSFTGADRDQPGFFDEAHQGTLFLDELGELQASMQVKLLRVLEDGAYVPVGGTKPKTAEARIICATNIDLAEMVRQGDFRKDLFYRVHVIDIELPPLRKRKEDIPLLVELFLSRFPSKGGKPTLTGKMMDTLSSYEWPGNVRELQNTIQRFLVTNKITLPSGGSIPGEAEDESPDFNDGLGVALDNMERRLIEEALRKTMWNRGQAADMLKISRWTLQRKMAKYDFNKTDDPS
ncbi:MAG: sigma 54-interacting transcriptional regulator [Desulfarculaceae bacterium]|nr:sigma 54-interacting transcriptional regulator [Desulfarculaceae bacterium]